MKPTDKYGSAPVFNQIRQVRAWANTMSINTWRKPTLLTFIGATTMLAVACGTDADQSANNTNPGQLDTDQTQSLSSDPLLLAQGRQIFRLDTFGEETQWTDTLRMHEVICTAIDPLTALSVGLKVDSEALPPLW